MQAAGVAVLTDVADLLTPVVQLNVAEKQISVAR
jgi:hypothetical protein